MNRYISVFVASLLFLLILAIPVSMVASNQSLQVQKLMTLPADGTVGAG